MPTTAIVEPGELGYGCGGNPCPAWVNLTKGDMFFTDNNQIFIVINYSCYSPSVCNENMNVTANFSEVGGSSTRIGVFKQNGTSGTDTWAIFELNDTVNFSAVSGPIMMEPKNITFNASDGNTSTGLFNDTLSTPVVLTNMSTLPGCPPPGEPLPPKMLLMNGTLVNISECWDNCTVEDRAQYFNSTHYVICGPTFGGDTTNFTAVADTGNFSNFNLVIEVPGVAKINYTTNVSMDDPQKSQALFEFAVKNIMAGPRIGINDTEWDGSDPNKPNLTLSAVLTLYNVSNRFGINGRPQIFRYNHGSTSGVPCPIGVCSDFVWDGENLTFAVTSFSDYGLTDSINVTLQTPSNLDYYNSLNVNFTYMPEWNSSITMDNCTLYGNFTGSWLPSGNNSTRALVNGTTNWINNTVGSDGAYIWNIYCYDITNQYDYYSSNRTVIVDTITDCGASTPCNCGDTLNASRTFSALDSLTDCSEDGLIINGTDIILDCAGYVINGTGGSGTTGVKINYSSNNTTVKNCIIHNFGTGIFGNASLDMNLTNNTIYGLSNYNGAGILISDASQTIGVSANITNNNITSETGSGVFCSVGTANVINNSISGYDYGIESGFSGSWGQIQGNNITTNYGLSGSVVFINSGSPNITENNVTGGYNGVYLYTAGSPKVWHNNIYGQSNYKIYSLNAINISYNNEGNYWGHNSCHVFVPGTDSNAENVNDAYAFNATNGWLAGSPVNCSPIWTNNSTNTTLAGIVTLYSLKWIDNNGLSGYIFSFDNCTGGSNLVNDTWVSMTGLTNWSNVTKTPNYTAGCNVAWKVYTNDSADNWNSTDTMNYTTKNASGFYCTQNSQCAGGYCVHNLCRAASTFCGDGYCDTGESCVADNSWCADGYACTNGCVVTGGTPGGSTGGSTGGTYATAYVRLAVGKINITMTSLTTSGKMIASIARYEDVAIRGMNITVVNNVGNIKIMISKLPALPSTVSYDIDGKAYHYINIERINITDPDINTVNIEFAVNKTWLTDNNIDASNITLYRWANNRWNDLSATKIAESATEAFYKADSPGLSVFIIGTTGGAPPEPEQEEEGCEESWSCAEWSECANEIQVRTCTDSNNCGTTVNKPAISQSCALGEAAVTGTTVTSILIPVIVIIAVIIICVLIFLQRTTITSFLQRLTKRSRKKSTKILSEIKEPFKLIAEEKKED